MDLRKQKAEEMASVSLDFCVEMEGETKRKKGNAVVCLCCTVCLVSLSVYVLVFLLIFI